MWSFWVEVNLCRFFIVYICILYLNSHWRSICQEGEECNPIKTFNPNTCLCLFQAKIWISIRMSCFFVNDFMWVVFIYYTVKVVLRDQLFWQQNIFFQDRWCFKNRIYIPVDNEEINYFKVVSQKRVVTHDTCFILLPIL